MHIDFRNLIPPRLQSGINHDDHERLWPQMLETKEQFLADKEKIDYTALPKARKEIAEAVEKARAAAAEFSTVVVIGIGGSDLGARAVHQALNHSYHNQVADGKEKKKIFFAGDTTDPTVIAQLTEVLALEDTLFIIISKSGNTIEQASNFVYFYDLLKAKFGAAEAQKHFLFITGSEGSSLMKLAQKQGFQTITHPEVGGRFAVLSAVGMVPATLSGLDVSKFLEGAADMQAKLDEAPASEDLALEYAEYQYHYAEKGKSITVMMPYLYNLRSFAQWFRQLWAESLGKRVNNDGELVHTGTTPVAAIGPTDQHSQLQLYNEGPNDKIITFIITDEMQENIPLPNNYEGLEDFAYFKGHNFADILKRELETTAYSLTKNERPNCTIHLPQLDEYNLAQLFYFFEQVTAYMGYLFEINTYNQPGVELSKNAMYGVLGKEGYEKQKEEFENFNSQ